MLIKPKDRGKFSVFDYKNTQFTVFYIYLWAYSALLFINRVSYLGYIKLILLYQLIFSMNEFIFHNQNFCKENRKSIHEVFWVKKALVMQGALKIFHFFCAYN